jgi:lipid A biosynthesis lauroyl/palmitoleoyl acyltransferase
MSDNSSPYQARYFLNPLYWPMWLVMGLFFVTSLLPYRAILCLASGLSWIGFYLLPQRRRIIRTNLRLIFPQRSDAEIRQLVRQTFFSSSMMLFEIIWAWWASDKKLQPLVRYEGLDNLRAAEALGKGVILLGSHFTTLEIQGRFMAYEADNIFPTYKRAHNSLFELVMTHNRRQMNKGLVASNDMRGILKLLKQKQVIWYAPDQDFGSERSVFAPFMGVQTATLTMTARLAKASNAPVVPLYCERLPGTQGYLVRLAPALANFPSGDDIQDATAINAAIEHQVQRVPDQYLWGHRRFKTRPRGEKQLYAPKRKYLRSYTATHALLALPVIAYTVWTALRYRDACYLRERLGLAQSLAAELIIHAASIGEINAVIPLIELLLVHRPQTSILLSMNTPSSRKIAQQRLGKRVRYRYMPIDWRWSVYRYLDRVRPHCVWVMETELWPNFAECCYYRGIRNIIINARLSERSLNASHRVQQWQGQAVQYIYAILARSNEDAKRYLALGAAADYVTVIGNIKYASATSNVTEAIELGREYVLLASSRDGEEKQIAQTWLSLPGDKPLLVIVPRHIRRAPEIQRELQPLTAALAVRSRQEKVNATTAVYLADTFGELKGFIQGARFVLMGGSFAPFGGQNIIEVAQAGKAVVFGPHMKNFHSEAQDFIAAGAGLQVEDQTQLAMVLTDLLRDPQRCSSLGDRGKQLVEHRRHIAEAYLAQLQQHCPLLQATHQSR